ncbi:expressed unknown protein [Seminavis robusta]|uniref:Uncharacterized protein n=1 Tax=Seminavis robusta TaxID=568900 RepID=A0A9N8EQE6_9STRA|nr:expressed unknown protein [Seminavis robusta]|eukprot:Sro1600_g285020.1 n/a (493) ;mRNA; f:6293-7895
MDESASPSSRQSRYLAILAPLVGALVVLAMATVSMDRPDQVSEWTVGTFLPEFMHRRLHHPHGEIAKYFACTRVLASSDHDYDNALNLEEYKSFMNTYADEHWSQQVGEDLPTELKEIFNKYAKATEGKSTDIIDIYGSRNGERDGISAHQEDLLEGLCNATDVTLGEMFKSEHETLGVTVTDVSEVREVGGGTAKGGVQRLAVNASFTMTLPEGMSLQDLLDSLESGEDPGHLRHAFKSFVTGVVGHIGGTIEEGGGDSDGNSTVDDATLDFDDNTTRRELERFGAGGIRGGLLIAFDATEEDNPARFRRLNIGFDPNSAEIYNYVESLCPGQNASSLVDSIKGTLGGIFGGNGTNSTDLEDVVEKSCVTAMGKYKIDVDEAEERSEGGLTAIYQKASDATKEAIDSGALETELEKEPDGDLFHVEGHGVVEDDSFDPFVEVTLQEEEHEKSMRTVDIILISVGSAIILCLCCVLCFVELERKTRPRAARG